MFLIKGEGPSNLRIAEVLKKEEELVKLWYYVGRTVKNYDNAELTPGLRRVVPERFDKSTGQVNLRPTSRDLNRGNLVKRADCFARGEIELAIASFAMHSDGKLLDVQVEKAEKWLRMRSKSDERALRALCQARQPGLAGPVVLARASGPRAQGQGPLRRSRSGRAPSDYGRVPGTDRRRVDWTLNVRVSVRSISMKPP